jgi:hypothetical protein
VSHESDADEIDVDEIDYHYPKTLSQRLQARSEEWIYDLNLRDHWLFRVYDLANEIWAWLVFRGVRSRAKELDVEIEGREQTARLRFLTDDDFEEFAELLGSLDVEHLPPHRLDREAAARALQRASYLPFGIFFEGKLVCYLLVRLMFPRRAVTGIWSNPFNHNRGFSQAGVRASGEFTVSQGLADYATIPIGNQYSVKTALYGGWKLVRTNRHFHVLIRQ